MTGISKTKYSAQAIENMSFDDGLKVKMVELIGADGVLKNLSTAGTVKWLYCLQSTSTNLRRIMLF